MRCRLESKGTFWRRFQKWPKEKTFTKVDQKRFVYMKLCKCIDPCRFQEPINFMTVIKRSRASKHYLLQKSREFIDYLLKKIQ